MAASQCEAVMLIPLHVLVHAVGRNQMRFGIPDSDRFVRRESFSKPDVNQYEWAVIDHAESR
jgi:hypothetical protein